MKMIYISGLGVCEYMVNAVGRKLLKLVCQFRGASEPLPPLLNMCKLRPVS